MNTSNRRAWLVWGVVLAVYLLAIFNRSSLGVAGLMAAERFDIRATQLALFTVVQLVVYAGSQVPVGVLIDRFGARRMLLAGIALMSVGQLLFALADSFALGLVARGVIGVGDAAVFTPGLRLIYAWFEPRRATVLGSLTGYSGQLGAIAASFPLTLLLRELGWTRTFAVAAVLGLGFLALVALLIRDSPDREVEPVPVRLHRLAREMGEVWRNPGTRLGLWAHFVTAFSITTFVMLWGYPFLVTGEGLSPAQANTILSLIAVATVAGGVLLTRITLRRRAQRALVVQGVVLVVAASWTVILLWPGRAPFAVLLVALLLVAAGGPASMIGFDLARTFNPDRVIGRANGIVNVGNFTGALIVAAAVGVILDVREPGGMEAYTLGDYKLALSSQYVLWALGLVQVHRYRRRALDHLAAEHPGALDALRRGDHYVPE